MTRYTRMHIILLHEGAVFSLVVCFFFRGLGFGFGFEGTDAEDESPASADF